MGRLSSVSTFFLAFFLVTLASQCYGQLQVGHYRGKCGRVDIERVIFEVVRRKFLADPDVASDLVRLLFHDCFVRGCDASVLLTGEDVEQTAQRNQRVGGFDATNDIKAVVERVCPGVVSCADQLVISARAGVYLAGGKWYEVETGRRDGRVSLRDEAQATLPPASMPVPDALRLFASRGLNRDDFVVLLGSHTLGTARCKSFKYRLYNFRNTSRPDPSLSPSMLQHLRATCPLHADTDNKEFLDQTPHSHYKFDNAYFKQILAYNGTMEIDSNMALNPLTRRMVRLLAYSPTLFLDLFGPAMNKMARIGVLTGQQGEIRRTCGSVN